MHPYLLGFAVLAAVVGCLLFQVGGFLLFPVALDLWDKATAERAQKALIPVDADPVK
ncbi:MAG: hypothetical protein IPL39_20965 [Opitutaceae bacterium]|nr:hypothetical protein [Opitutaceae bacterium]